MKKIKITIGTGYGFRKNHERIASGASAVMIAQVQKHLMETCGGYTMTHAYGGWRDDRGHDWQEPSLGFVVILDAENASVAFAQSLAAFVRDTFDQVCVMLTIEEVNTQFI